MRTLLGYRPERSSSMRIGIVGERSVSWWRTRVARDWRTRAIGLLGHAEPEPGEAVWLCPCRAVHTLGMRYAIDVALLDRNGTILSLHTLAPGDFVADRHAWSTLEARAGEWRRCGVAVGQSAVRYSIMTGFDAVTDGIVGHATTVSDGSVGTPRPDDHWWGSIERVIRRFRRRSRSAEPSTGDEP